MRIRQQLPVIGVYFYVCQNKCVLEESMNHSITVFFINIFYFCSNCTGDLFAASALKCYLDRQKYLFGEEISAENNANLQCVRWFPKNHFRGTVPSEIIVHPTCVSRGPKSGKSNLA